MDFRGRADLPLGIRNNNPGNLREVGITWKGKVGSNKGFTTFDSMENGVRAFSMDIRSKINRGLNTIRKIITVYAPPSENNTTAYINSVSKSSGIPADRKLTPDGDTLYLLAKSMFAVENGSASKLISDAVIIDGIRRGSAVTFSKDTLAGISGIALLIILFVLLIK